MAAHPALCLYTPTHLLEFFGHQDHPITHPILQPSLSATRAFQSNRMN